MPRLAATMLLGALISANTSANTGATIERLDVRADKVFGKDAVVERVAEGFSAAFGPVWDPKRRVVLFSDAPRNQILAWFEGRGTRVFHDRSGYGGSAPFYGFEPGSAGLAIDTDGRLVVCQHGDRRVVRMEADGRFTVLADRYQGKRFNSPNDVVVAKSGDIYFTDPPFGLPDTFADSARELPFSGVYKRAPDGKISLVTKELDAPGGLALSPDERTLYVSNKNAVRAVWMAFPLDHPSEGRVLYDATPAAKKERTSNPAGLEVDASGNLFATGPGGLLVISPDGALIARVAVAATNVAWGNNGAVLYMTTETALYRLKLK